MAHRLSPYEWWLSKVFLVLERHHFTTATELQTWPAEEYFELGLSPAEGARAALAHSGIKAA